MKVASPCIEFQHLTDAQLLEEMRKNEAAHTCIYLQHKSYCINFMLSKGASESDALDIYQDATIVLYEKSRDPEFTLTSSIQTYLNKVCYNQFLARGKSSYTKKTELPGEMDETVSDWFEEDDNQSREQISKMRIALNALKAKSDKCHERLYLFYYENLKNDEIATKLGLKDADTVKNLIHRCRQLLKTMINGL